MRNFRWRNNFLSKKIDVKIHIGLFIYLFYWKSTLENIMKTTISILLTAIACFFLGWFVHDMYGFAKGVQEDAERRNRFLKKRQDSVAKDFTDRILDQVIDSREKIPVEFPHIYDSLFTFIPGDKDEKLILAEKLKARGFKVVSTGRGNLPPLGPRIVLYTMSDDACECEVSKKYYSTIEKSTYTVIEGISCRMLISR
jgi:hypothetical protein